MNLTKLGARERSNQKIQVTVLAVSPIQDAPEDVNYSGKFSDHGSAQALAFPHVILYRMFHG